MDREQLFFIEAFLALLAWPASVPIARRWAARNPDKQPFGWGFFTAMLCLFHLGIPVFAYLTAKRVTYGSYSFLQYHDGLEDLMVLGTILGVCGIFMLMRNRWVWIIGILFQLNPVLWISNGIYLANRWGEMRRLPKTPPPLPRPSRSMPNALPGSSRKLKLELPAVIYLYQGDQHLGPFTPDQFREMWQSRQVALDALIRGEGESEWGKPDWYL